MVFEDMNTIGNMLILGVVLAIIIWGNLRTETPSQMLTGEHVQDDD
jgi:hypothetical protein